MTTDLLTRAQAGDADSFRELVEPQRLSAERLRSSATSTTDQARLDPKRRTVNPRLSAPEPHVDVKTEPSVRPRSRRSGASQHPQHRHDQSLGGHASAS